MDIQIILLKIIISITSVIGVSYIAEKISTRFSGIILGFPLGSAIMLFFYGMENSPEFAAQSAIWNMNGLVATLFFVFF